MSPTRDEVAGAIRRAFRDVDFPGDAFLQGSFEGCEPYEEVEPFKGRIDWAALDPAFLDARHCALSFFSEGGFRFFIPAYLLADLRGELLTADPTFHLTHGFSDHSYEERREDRVVLHRWGRTKLVNPRRYGAMTTLDHARCRLSVFTREEAAAIVMFLEWKRDHEAQFEHERRAIDAALDDFWRERSRHAPTAEALRLDRSGA